MTEKQIDNVKIERRIDEIRNELIRYGISKERIDELLSNREAKFPYDENTLLKIVSGKDFLIPYFKHHIEKQLNCSFKLPKETWKFNLVDKCNISRLESLKQAILSA